MERRSETEESLPTEPPVYEGEWEDLPPAPPTDASPASPRASSPTFEETYERAGFWLRLIAAAIDATILGAFAVLLLLVSLFTTFMSEGFGDFVMQGEDFSLFPLWTACLLIASAAYFTILQSEYGQTIGKSLLGLEVRAPDGAFLNYSQALFRWLAYGVSAVPCGLGFLWIGLNPGKRGWHDLLANTVVVTLRHQDRK
jgi:uncharacterized RDD family membrane protein YckC